MRFLDKLALKIFSIIIFIIAIGLILVISGILSVDTIINQIMILTDGNYGIQISIIILAVLILLAIKGLFFTSKSIDNSKEGIILENTSGKLVISKESLENLIYSVIKDVPGADTVTSKTILDKNRNLIVFVTVIVSKDVMLKDISTEIQKRIKDAMKRTADLEVKEVNIRIKNITSKKVKGLPAPSENIEENTIKEETKKENETGEE